MGNSNVPGSKQNVDVQIRGTVYDPNVAVQYKTKILQKNVIDSVNTLTQEMVSSTNTKYVIKYDFDLSGEEIEIPEGCILEFDGGSISNGHIICNNTYIKGICPNFSVTISGFFSYDTIDTFGISPTNTATKNTENIERFFSEYRYSCVFGSGEYLFSHAIDFITGTIKGKGKFDTVLHFTTGGIKLHGQNSDVRYHISLGADSSVISDITVLCDSGNCIDLAPNAHSPYGAMGSNIVVENVILNTNGSGIYCTNKNHNIYNCHFRNITFFNAQYAFNNVGFVLASSIENCIYISVTIIFNDCYFNNTQIYGNNMAQGGATHFIVAHSGYEGFASLAQSLFIYDCNFEEFTSNLIVFYNDDLSHESIFNIYFYNCDFNYGNSILNGNTIYDLSPSNKAEIVSKTFTSKDDFFPIIGKYLVPHFDKLCTGNVRDNGIVYNLSCYAHVSVLGGSMTNYVPNKPVKIYNFATGAESVMVDENTISFENYGGSQHTVDSVRAISNLIVDNINYKYVTAKIEASWTEEQKQNYFKSLKSIIFIDDNVGEFNLFYFTYDRHKVRFIVSTSSNSIYIYYGATRITVPPYGVLMVLSTNYGRVESIPLYNSKTFSNSRPENPWIGQSYYDETLGKPIWWTGNTSLGDNGWVDAEGNNPNP